MDLPAPLTALADEPYHAAILLDIDGTLAPIVDDPGDARVPAETRAELRRLVGKYALVGCLTGRTREQALEIVGVPELEYIGEHGLELAPDADEWLDVLAELAAAADWPVERKRLTLAYHYRTADDEAAALEVLRPLAERAERLGLRAKWGRKVLELRPPVDADKGTAVAHLLERRGIDRAMFAGDDVTDLDAFRAMDALPLGVKVAIATSESPPQLTSEADVVVAGPVELLQLLKAL